MAVITALLLTTLAITIVSSLFWQQQVQVRSIENQRLQLQKQWILRGALDWARLILREDAKYSAVDTLDEPWAVPLAETRLDQYVEHGRADTDMADAALSGSIIDAQSRYNLNNLCRAGSIVPEEVAVFKRLLSSLRVNPLLAQATADQMAMSCARSKPGVPGAVQAGNNQPQPMELAQVDDLLAVPGFTPQIIASLQEYVILLPGPAYTPLNVNTASAEALAARVDTLSVADAAALVTARKTAPFRNIGDLRQRMPGLPTGFERESFNSSYFLVNGKVRMSRAGLEVQALVQRTVASTKIIWIREN